MSVAFFSRLFKKSTCTAEKNVYESLNEVEMRNLSFLYSVNTIVIDRCSQCRNRYFLNESNIRGWVRKFCHRWCNFVNKHDRLLYYTLIERATFLLYNDAKIMPEINKYLVIDDLKDTWWKTNGTFSRICEYYYVRFLRHIFITTDQIFSNFTVINNSIFRNAM